MTKQNTAKLAPATTTSRRAKALTPRDMVRVAAEKKAEDDRVRTRLYHRRQRLLKALGEARDSSTLKALSAEARELAPQLSGTIRQRVDVALAAAHKRLGTAPAAPAAIAAAVAAPSAPTASITKAQLVATLEVQLVAARNAPTQNQARIETLETTLRLAKLLG